MFLKRSCFNCLLVGFLLTLGCGRNPEPQGSKEPVAANAPPVHAAPQAASTPPQVKPTVTTSDSQGTAISSAAFRQTTIPLDEAVKNGKVEAEITGMGGSTGDAILVVVRRKVSEPLILTLTPGTVFKSVSGTVQDMLGASIKGEREGETSYRPDSQVILNDDGKHAYVVEAYCLDFHKSNPGTSDSFTLAPMEDRPVKILQAGKATSASIQAIQAALWMGREGIGATQLKERFPVSDADIEVARRFLAEVKPTEPPPPAAAPKTTATSTPPSTRSLEKLRTWTDNTGTHKIEATFVELKEGKVQLRRADGTTTNVPLERLSEADRDFANAAASPQSTAPTASPGAQDRTAATPPKVISKPSDDDDTPLDAIMGRGPVTAMRFSTNGELFASGTQQGVAELREAKTEKVLGSFRPGSRRLSCIAFSPDCKTAVLFRSDPQSPESVRALKSIAGHIEFWDFGTTSDRPRLRIKCDPRPNSFAFSLDGKSFATGGDDNAPAINVWDARDGRVITTLQGHSRAVTHLAFSPNALNLVSLSNDKTIILWNLTAGRKEQALEDNFEGNAADQGSATFSPDGTLIAAAQGDKIVIWDVPGGYRKFSLDTKGSQFEGSAIAFTPDSKRLARPTYQYKMTRGLFGTTEGLYHSIALWDVATGTRLGIIASYDVPNVWFNHVAFSPDGKTVVAGGYYVKDIFSNVLKFWRVNEPSSKSK